MARRRSSPHPAGLRDLSDSDNDFPPSEDELFLDREDPHSLVQESPGFWSSLFSKFQSDPHAPKRAPLTPKQTRRQARRQKRRERRARRRGGKLSTESSTLYNADSAAEEAFRDEDSSSSDWSDKEYWDDVVSRARGKVARSWLRLGLLSLAGGFMLGILVLAILRIMRKHERQDDAQAPTAKPATLYNNGTSNFGPTTILISLDGFRADFLNRGDTPVLSSFVSQGVSPDYMMPSFPSVTFPNHWTLVTGLHPESHGVVGNSFWDDELGEEFYYTDPARSMFPKWWQSTGAEPLWATAERQGIRSAVHMWPGSEAGLVPAPKHIDKFRGDEKLSHKVSSVLAWIDLPSPFDGPDGEVDQSLSDPRPQFISMYVPDVDSDGHKFGPNSTQVRDTVGRVDEMVGQLLSGLKDRNLSEIVNVVVVSDHGMATTSRDRLVQYEDIVNPDDIERIHGWPLYGLRPKAGVDVQQLYEQINAKWSASNNPGWSVYNHETMPGRWHFTANRRIAPLFLVPDAGWAIVTKQEMDLSNPINANAIYHPAGIHGYDNQHPLMRAIFVAKGPAFPHPPGSRVEPFQNTEVYNIVCQSLGVKPMPHNGTLALPLKTSGVHGEVPGAADDVGQDKGDTGTDSSPADGEKPGEAEPAPEAGDESPEQDHDAGGDNKDDGAAHDGTLADGLSKAKEKIEGLWDKFRQGFDKVSGKVSGWLHDTFGDHKGGSRR